LDLTSTEVRPVFTAEAIAARVSELAAAIRRDSGNEEVFFLCILKGAFMFMADLSRAIDRHARCEFIGISSYGKEKSSSGEVRLTKDLDSSIEGANVLVVEDIVDTGLTLSYLLANLESRGAASVRLAALLDKFERREREVQIDYLGFKIPDEFVVGYGLDFAERYRELPYIGVLRPSVYSRV